MRYTVISPPLAEEELALYWFHASDRDAITKASHQIDLILQRDPFSGQRQNDCFVLTVSPLTVTYHVSPDDLRVTIRQYLYHG